MPRPPDIFAALIVAIVLPGCTPSIDDHSDGSGDAMHSLARHADPMSAEDNKEVAGYVDYMAMLAAIDEAGWDRIFANVSKATASNPTPENQLRLALVLCRADRPAGDLRTARDLLAELAGGAGKASPAVRKVAGVKLVETEHRIALYRTTSFLRSQLAVAKTEMANEKRERTRVELERIRIEEDIERIQSALADALAKLQAVTNIERAVERSQNEAPIP